jgi:hypothetical protein
MHPYHRILPMNFACVFRVASSVFRKHSPTARTNGIPDRSVFYQIGNTVGVMAALITVSSSSSYVSDSMEVGVFSVCCAVGDDWVDCSGKLFDALPAKYYMHPLVHLP